MGDTTLVTTGSRGHNAIVAGWLVRRMLWRRQAGSLLVIAVIAGSAGGLAAGLVGGAARAGSAAERFLAQTRLLDLMVTGPGLTVEQADQVRALPGVEGVALLSAVGLMPHDGPRLAMTANPDGRLGSEVDVPRIVRGRAAAPGVADEIVLNESSARALRVDVGDTVRFDSWSPEQVEGWTASGNDPTEKELSTFLGPSVELEVVGISRHPTDLLSDDPSSYFTPLPPGVWREYEGEVAELGYRFLAVDLGEAPTAAEEAAVALQTQRIVGPDSGVEEAGELAGSPLLTTLDFVATAMVALAAATALAGLAVAGLAVARTATRAADDTAELRPLGMTDRERSRAVATAITPAACGAAFIALVTAVASSAIFPFGVAGRAEPDPGLRFQAPVVLVGAAATAAVVMGVAAAAAVVAVRHRKELRSPRGRSAAVWLSGLGLPAGPLCGLDLALGPGPRRWRAGQVGIAGVALAALTASGALVLSTSLDHVFSTSSTFGWTWDYLVPDGAVEELADDPAVESVGVVAAAPIAIDGRRTVTRGISSRRGEPPVLVVEGRRAERGEVVLGGRTMADLGVAIGDTVVASGSVLDRRELRVVGKAVFAGVLDIPEAGRGAAMPVEELMAIGPTGDIESRGVVSLEAGADTEAFVRRVEEQNGEAPETVQQPVELQQLREISAFPDLLAAFLLTIGLMAVAYAVVVTCRRRRADIAVLRSLGLSRRGVCAAISTQAGVQVLAGAALGVPLGIAAGQALWRSLAVSLGLVDVVVVPWSLLGALTVLGVAAAAVLALVPARSLVRAKPAVALRAE